MSGKAKYKKAYIDDVINLSLVKGKVSNHFIAKWLHVDEKTIRNWRKDYYEFDHAFHHAADILKKELAETARQNTKIRKRKIIKTTADGETTTIEEVLPSHNDIAVYKKMGSMKSSLTMKSINKRILKIDTRAKKISRNHFTRGRAIFRDRRHSYTNYLITGN
ncbi:hypothetical protein [Candidatus Arsenophonus triatominarum]|uniref:hypothetical protein n=1 Tax=Candidatus Arsenophonus triatominarum TaxID=57911 RepID=UPI0007C4F121|nr:hypothetical protein [Candidatus Arsenophonus triatominarum]